LNNELFIQSTFVKFATHLMLVFRHKLLCDCSTNEKAQMWRKKEARW
jgi:hypothetical protein